MSDQMSSQQPEQNPAQFWDLRFSAPEFMYGKAPNVTFKQLLDQLEPGKLLLPGEGQGRNAAYAAAHNWDVLAFDASSVARERALELAAEQHLNYRYLTADLNQFDPGAERFDLIAMIFIHLMPEQRPIIHRRLSNWLKPGGYILVEAFAKGQLQYKSGGPPIEAALYSPELLQADFSGLNLLELEELTDVLDEGKHHRGEARLVRLIGQKA